MLLSNNNRFKQLVVRARPEDGSKGGGEAMVLGILDISEAAEISLGQKDEESLLGSWSPAKS